MNWSKIVVRGCTQIGNKFFWCIPQFPYGGKNELYGVYVIAFKQLDEVDYIRFISNTRYD